MRIAIPICQGRISPLFDVASRVLLVRFKNRTLHERREVVWLVSRPEECVRSLVELGANLVICGAVSEDLQERLEQAGIRVFAHVCGEVELVLEAYLARKLRRPEFAMPGCYAFLRSRRQHRCGCQRHCRSSERGTPVPGTSRRDHF